MNRNGGEDPIGAGCVSGGEYERAEGGTPCLLARDGFVSNVSQLAPYKTPRRPSLSVLSSLTDRAELPSQLTLPTAGNIRQRTLTELRVRQQAVATNRLTWAPRF